MAVVNALEVEIQRKVFQSPAGDEFIAAENLRFSVPKGQFACIVGPSGSGKTTLLHIVSGLDTKFAGSVTVAGLPAAEAQIGYMFQSPRLMPWLNVIDNVRLVATDAAKAAGKPEQLLERMGLGAFLDSFPNRLSGGMQRRVALARAFVNDPPLLLLDEPFISLDEPVAQRLRSLLLDLWQQHGATIVFVTHDLREAVYLGDRILFMSPSPGRVVLDYPVGLGRPRTYDEASVEEVRHRLLREHPAILAGLEAQPSNDGSADPARAQLRSA